MRYGYPSGFFSSSFFCPAIQVIFIFLFSPLFLSAMDWPIENPSLVSGFGDKGSNGFLTGVYLVPEENQEVTPVEKGEVVFYVEEGLERKGDLPSGLGSFIVIEHEAGLKSLYGHLEAGTLDPTIKEVTKTTELGKVGDTGGAAGEQLYLEIIDKEFGQFINPQLVLPSLDDSVPPVIGTVSLKRGSEELVLSNRDVLPRGKGRLLVEMYDPIPELPYFNPTAPYQVSVFANGVEVITITFETVQENQGTLHLPQNKSLTCATFCISDTKYDLGELQLNPGETRLEIIVKDVAGNESMKELSLTVTE
jgi:hypothetical protein